MTSTTSATTTTVTQGPTSAPITTMDADLLVERSECLVDFIMKKCLWQFHSRAWDRTRQNEQILGMTADILCDEPIVLDTPDSRVYWADASYMAEEFRKRFPWVAASDKDELRAVMTVLHQRIEYLTVTGSLNEELTDIHY